MKWYKNLNKQQKNDFNKVVAVCVLGTFIVLLIPAVLI